MSIDHLVAATAEAGEPSTEVNPFAPKESRAFGDAFVHYIDEAESGETLIRFWFPAEPSGVILPIDFERLKPSVPWPGGASLPLEIGVVAKLIAAVFFQDLTDDYYQDSVDILSFRNLQSHEEFELPYPASRLSAQDIG